MKEIGGGVSAALGFAASGISCGLKQAGKKDLAVVWSEKAAQAAAVFTTNRVVAAPVLFSRASLDRSRQTRAIVVNSGCANACTGGRGLKDAELMAAWTASELGLKPAEVLVASTGVIGQYLPMNKIKTGIGHAVKSLAQSGNGDAAEAIMTTDTVSKEVAVEFEVCGHKTILGGMAKGAGMIAPDMATMIGVLTTDAAIEKEILKNILKPAVDRSFNLITVDGQMSTNDAVCLFANGAGEGSKVSAGRGLQQFVDALDYVCQELAMQIVKDGEGATKLVSVTVDGAETEAEAKEAALAIANSNLVKTAVFGADANWGRVMAALGASTIRFDPLGVDVYMGEAQVVKAGVAYSEMGSGPGNSLSGSTVAIRVNLNSGDEATTVWTTDLSYDYVKINAEYHT